MTWSLTTRPSHRVIVDNDFSGDPDDLFALAHQVLSPSADVRGVIGSHLAPGDSFDPSTVQAENAVAAARALMGLLGRDDIPVAQGGNLGLRSRTRADVTAAARMIVQEANREDTDLPLIITLGGGLSELAAAWLLDPTIESRVTAIWIGGPEYPDGPAAPPRSRGPEYNMNIDIMAAQVVFNDSAIPIVQVPRDAYRQCIVSLTELEPVLRSAGAVGDYLAQALFRVFASNEQGGHRMGETYVMGDNPLVLLGSLRTPWQPHFSSTEATVRSTPFITDEGAYADRAVRCPRPIQVCTRLDTRLMLADMFTKLRALGVNAGPRADFATTRPAREGRRA